MNTPFHIDPDYPRIINNSQQGIIRYETKRNHLLGFSMNEDEEK